MSKRSMNSGNRDGMTLIVVMGLTLLSSAVVASVFFTMAARVRQAYRQVHLEQAFYLAEAGMERAAAYVAGSETDTTLTGTLGDGSYVATVTCTDLSGGEIGIEVVSTGTVNNVSRGVTVRGLRKVSWARYAFWYDREALTLWMAPGDSFRGRFYAKPLLRFSNSGISSKGKVRFYDKAWTVQDHIVYDSGAYPICDMGLITSADVQSMASVDFDYLKTEAYAEGLVLDGDATITIAGTTMRVTNRRNGWSNQVVPIPESGLIYARACTFTEQYYSNGRWRTRTVSESGDISISAPNGLAGRVTLVAEQDINVVNHVRYASNPATNPDSTDALGLIAQRSVVVTTAAPSNLDIYAHILCKNGGFGVANYNQGNLRGTLNVYGGIANLVRNAVGVVGTSGYLKLYVFDVRFAKKPPPYYPKLVDELEWAGWEG